MDFLRNESIVHSGQIHTDCLLRMCLDVNSLYDYCFSFFVTFLYFCFCSPFLHFDDQHRASISALVPACPFP